MARFTRIFPIFALIFSLSCLFALKEHKYDASGTARNAKSASGSIATITAAIKMTKALVRNKASTNTITRQENLISRNLRKYLITRWTKAYSPELFKVLMRNEK